MKDNVLRSVQRYQRTFLGFTAGQKAVAIVGSAALLLAAVLVFRWVSAPTYAPLFSNLSGKDAAAVVDKLDSQGIQYKITNDGATIMVPRGDVYKTRITLSGEGLPTASDGGYSLLDTQDLSTSQFKEQTDFKRAMEGELSKTVGALDGVESAVVHLALPTKQVFADKQDPATASVLLQTKPGTTLDPGQVQAVVHLVASSIDGLDPAKVTVADASGRLLSTTAGTDGSMAASSRNQQVDDFQTEMGNRIQAILDRVVGPGNSTVQVTADLNFDKSVKELRTYKKADPAGLALSSAVDSETYTGANAGSQANGVVGPDGQMDTGTTTTGTNGQGGYTKKSERSDAALNTTTERREVAPGGVNALHVGMVIDQTAAASTDPQQIQDMVASALGINPKRGDTMNVAILPFDRSTETAAAKELKAQAAAAKKDQTMSYIRTTVLAVLLLGGLVLAWFRSRRKNKQRQEATSYVVEQLRVDAAARAAAEERALATPATSLLSLEGREHSEQDAIRDELATLVENQPEDVAALLRGWLVERS